MPVERDDVFTSIPCITHGRVRITPTDGRNERLQLHLGLLNFVPRVGMGASCVGVYAQFEIGTDVINSLNQQSLEASYLFLPGNHHNQDCRKSSTLHGLARMIRNAVSARCLYLASNIEKSFIWVEIVVTDNEDPGNPVETW